MDFVARPETEPAGEAAREHTVDGSVSEDEPQCFKEKEQFHKECVNEEIDGRH